MRVRQGLALFFFLIFLTGIGTAQDTSQSSENSSVIQLSDTVRITEYNFDGLDLTIVFDSDVPQMISIVDQNSFEQSGAGTPNVKITRLSAGKTTVNMKLEPRTLRSSTVFISQGTDGFATLSDRESPLLESVFLRDLPIVGFMSVICGFGQFFLRRYWDRLRLGWGIRWT